MKIRMGYRYAAILVIGASFGLLCSAMVKWRAMFEPLAIPLFRLMFRGQRYQPDDYWVYPALCALLSIIALANTVYSIATHKAVEQRIDRYLEARPPRHDSEQGG